MTLAPKGLALLTYRFVRLKIGTWKSMNAATKPETHITQLEDMIARRFQRPDSFSGTGN